MLGFFIWLIQIILIFLALNILMWIAGYIWVRLLLWIMRA